MDGGGFRVSAVESNSELISCIMMSLPQIGLNLEPELPPEPCFSCHEIADGSLDAEQGQLQKR